MTDGRGLEHPETAIRAEPTIEEKLKALAQLATFAEHPDLAATMLEAAKKSAVLEGPGRHGAHTLLLAELRTRKFAWENAEQAFLTKEQKLRAKQALGLTNLAIQLVPWPI